MKTGSAQWKTPYRSGLVGWLPGIICMLSPVPVLPAQESSFDSSLVVNEDIYVTAKRPGPALWQVTNGDNILYIFGVLQPLPKDFEWDSARADWVISQSQEFIAPPAVYIHSANPLRMLQLNRLKKLAEDQKLVDVISPELLDPEGPLVQLQNLGYAVTEAQ